MAVKGLRTLHTAGMLRCGLVFTRNFYGLVKNENSIACRYGLFNVMDSLMLWTLQCYGLLTCGKFYGFLKNENGKWHRVPLWTLQRYGFFNV